MMPRRTRPAAARIGSGSRSDTSPSSAPSLVGDHDREELDGVGDALQPVGALALHLDALAQRLGGRGRDQDVAIELARRGLDARGDVHRVADDAEVQPPGAADGAGDDAARC